MPATRRASIGLCAAGVCAPLILAGCYSSPPYGYGYQSNPGFYSSPPPGVYSTSPVYPGAGAPLLGQPSSIPPGTTFPPGTTVPPGGTFVPGTSYPPGSIPPGGMFPGSPTYGVPTPANPGTGSTQPFPADTSTTRGFQPLPQPRSSTKEQPVPNYVEPFSEDPARKPRGTFSPPKETFPTTPRGTPSRSFHNDDVDGPSPFKSGQVPKSEPVEADSVASAKVPAPSGPALLAHNTVVLAAATVEAAEGAPPVASPLFGYDRENYQWLHGTVDYDEEDETWFIIYNLAPDESDAHQGGLTLAAGDAALAELKHGDYVRLEGHVDPQRLDRRGAPMFCVDQVAVVRRAGL